MTTKTTENTNAAEELEAKLKEEIEYALKRGDTDGASELAENLRDLKESLTNR